MPRNLVDLEVMEISLCDKPANRKKFYIVKQEDKLTFKEIRDLYEEKKDQLDKETKDEMDEAFNRFDEVRDDMTDELIEGLQTIIAFAVANFGEREGEGYPYPKPYGEGKGYPYPKPSGYNKRDSRIFKEKSDLWPSL